MAGIVSNDVVVSFKKISTWGTAVSVAGGFRLRCSSLSISGGFDEITERDIGAGKKQTDMIRGVENVNVSLTCDYSYGQNWLPIIAGILGTESVPSETTPSQGDYSRNIDLADSTYGASAIVPGWTMAWTIEDATYIVELPSVKFNSFVVNMPINAVPTITFSGVADRVLMTGYTNSYATVTGVSAPAWDYELAVFGGGEAVNHYLRMNDASGATLAAGDNIWVENIEISLNRPLAPQHVLQGASSPYIIAPKEIGAIEGTVRVTLGESKEGTYAYAYKWANATDSKGAIYTDGDQIASGVKTSLTWIFPKLRPMGSLPGGYDIPNNSSLMKPVLSFKMLKASAAPSGMSVTDYLRLVSFDRRSTKWTA